MYAPWGLQLEQGNALFHRALGKRTRTRECLFGPLRQENIFSRPAVGLWIFQASGCRNDRLSEDDADRK